MVYSACRRPDASLPGVISCKGVNNLKPSTTFAVAPKAVFLPKPAFRLAWR